MKSKIYLEVEKFEEGTCFICRGKTDIGYIHYECAVAYSDEKSKRIKKANEQHI